MSEETIHLLDDDSQLRKALSRLLRAEGYEVRAYASAREFLADNRAEEVDCLLLDVQMPGLSGLELQRRLVSSGAVIPIVFLTGHGDIPMSVRAVKAGAIDFLTKPVEADTLLGAVRNALKASASNKDERDEITLTAARFCRLTPREREVMEAVVAGKPNKLIAAELGTCEQTVKVHRGRVMTKMATASLAELVHSADRLQHAKSHCT